jgi:hypothetical protein
MRYEQSSKRHHVELPRERSGREKKDHTRDPPPVAGTTPVNVPASPPPRGDCDSVWSETGAAGPGVDPEWGAPGPPHR